MAPPNAESLRFLLRDVQIEGSTAFSLQELRKLYEAEIGTEVSVADIFGMADRITTLYHERGYVLSRAVVPAQQISSGIVTIRVIEGYVSDIVLEGDVGRVRSLIESYLLKIVNKRPVALTDVERAMLLVDDLPGISATSVLRPGTEFGAAQLVVTVGRKSFDVYATTNNRGSDFIGPWTSAVGASENSFTSLGEQGSLLFFTAWPPKEQLYGGGDLRLHLGAQGLQLHGFASYAPSEPQSTLKDLDIEQSATRAGADGSYPLVRTRDQSIWLEGGYAWSLTRSDSSGEKLFRDVIDTFWGGARGELRDRFGGINTASLSLHQGAPLPGYTRKGSSDKSRANASGVYTALQGGATRWQRITDHIALFGAYQGQYSPDPLLTDAQIKFGGTNFVRGYPPAELSGDSGQAVSVELRLSDAPGWKFVDFVQLYSFFEYGIIWNHGEDVPQSQSLRSAGVGLRLQPKKWLFLELEFANGFDGQLSGNDTGEKPHNVYFTATASF